MRFAFIFYIVVINLSSAINISSKLYAVSKSKSHDFTLSAQFDFAPE